MTDVAGGSAADLDRELLLGWLRQMLLIRNFEEVGSSWRCVDGSPAACTRRWARKRWRSGSPPR
jgi:TPP-dependent pyruvate/acetoin dehydrogenase alpha subunit